MKRKFKVGDIVKVKKGMDLSILSIEEDIIGDKLKVTDASDGRDNWNAPSVNGQPTYSVDGWRIPGSYLKAVK